MLCCRSCGRECVTGEFIVPKPTSNQQFHTHKPDTIQTNNLRPNSQLTPRHHRYDAGYKYKWCMLSRVNHSR